MPTSKAMAVWEGKLKDGKGTFKAGSGAFSGPYSFATRFEGKAGTNPEELIAAAHAACFSMALSAGLEKAGKPVTRVETTAACTLGMVEGSPKTTRLHLTVPGTAPRPVRPVGVFFGVPSTIASVHAAVVSTRVTVPGL